MAHLLSDTSVLQHKKFKMETESTWFILLSIMLCIQVARSADIKCLPGKKNCSQCYAELVKQVTLNDNNQFEVQRTFFPPDQAPPSFVTVVYEYYEDGEFLEDQTDVWFWSTSTFYLYHPLHVFQFTSLLFSDLSQRAASLTLKLDADCRNADEDHMRLFTQRLKIHATAKSIASPISDEYDPKAETAATINKWHHDNTGQRSDYITCTFYMFPFITIPVILIAVLYFNDLAEDSRMKKIETIFSGKNNDEVKSLKYQLQNEWIMSHTFALYTIILSACGLGFLVDTEKHFNKEVVEYFSVSNGTLRSRHFSGLPIATFILDVVSIIGLEQIIVVIALAITSCLKKKDLNMWMWRYCAYSIVLPLCCAANHLNYIIIAFIHDVYHATAVAILYGVVIFFLYAALTQISFLLDKLRSCICTNKEESQNASVNASQTETLTTFSETPTERSSNYKDFHKCCCTDCKGCCIDFCKSCCADFCEDRCADFCEDRCADFCEDRCTDFCEDRCADFCKSCCADFCKSCCADFCKSCCADFCKSCCADFSFCNFMNLQLLIKSMMVIFLTVYLLYDIFIYYILPINKAIDDATNHLLSLYQTTAVFFTAVVVYFFFKKPYRSPISIFTRAENEKHVFCSNDEWKNKTPDEHDLLIAGNILQVLHTLKNNSTNIITPSTGTTRQTA